MGAAIDAMEQAAVVYLEGGPRRGIVSVGPEGVNFRLFRYVPVHADSTGLERTIVIPYEEILDCRVGSVLARIATMKPWLGLVQLTTARHGKLSFSVPRAGEFVAATQAMRTP